MFSPNCGVLCTETDSREESMFISSPISKIRKSDAQANVNNLKTTDSPITPHLQRTNLFTPCSVPNLRCREDFPSNPLFPVNCSPSYPRKPSLLHAASINEEIDRLQYTLSGVGLRLLESKDKFGRTPLMYACLGDRPKCVSLLLSAGASLISVDDFGRNAFHWAAVKGLYECYKIMFKHEIKMLTLHGDKSVIMNSELPWRKKDRSGATPLHLATSSSSTKCLSFILKNAQDEDINCPDSKLRTPLHWAASAGNSEAVRLMLKAKAKVNILDENGKPPLFYAVSSVGRKPVACVKLILEKLPDVIKWHDNEGRYALHLAVADQEHNPEVVDYLLTHCKNWNDMEDKNRQTPLHWAAMLGRTLSARSLLSNISEKSAIFGINCATPLHFAAAFNHTEIIALIIDLDEKLIDVTDSEGRTALIWAANNDSCESVRELVKLGANLEHCDIYGYSALHVASAKGLKAAAKLLVEHGADVNSKAEIGNTPLISACKYGQLNTFELLRDNGADIETYNIFLRRPIHVAVGAGNTEILYNLVKLDADLNCKDILGLSPLHLACQDGSADCTSILVERGARCDIQDEEGRTPLHYAVAKGDEEVVQMLLDHSADVNVLSCNGETALDICIVLGHKILQDLLSKHGGISSNDMTISATITPKYI